MRGFKHSITSCFQVIGKSSYDKQLARLSAERTSLQSGACKLTSALLALPFAQDDIAAIAAQASKLREEFAHVVVIGSGGSGLSGRMLTHLASPVASSSLHFLENIDPELMDDLLAAVDCKKTCFIVISKSGGTVETISQFYALVQHMKIQVGEKALGRHFIIITMPTKNPLRESADQYGMTILDHPADIGGRFSALTAVGLLPAALAGLDIAKLREGAAAIVTQLKQSPEITQFAPAQGAALQYAAMEVGKNISVMLPYSERLCGFSAWYRQSWAESLGKDGKGTTPIRAVGSTDQHSQLQLYLSGPKDKFFTFITCKRSGSGLPIQAPANLNYLAGKTLGDVMEAEQRATLATLISSGCPVRHIEMEHVGEYEMGALLMHFMLEIIFMAKLLGVNPFDQPAVEEGKVLARDYLLGKNI